MGPHGQARHAGLLARLLRATHGAVDADAVLTRTAELLVAGPAGAFADWVLADRLEEPDLVVRVSALGAAGPLRLPAGPPDGTVVPRGRRSSAAGAGVLAALRAAGQPVLRLDAAGVAGMLASPDARLRAQVELVQALGTQDTLVLGTAARGRLNGVLSLGRTGVPFSADDLVLAEVVALHVGLALDAARLFESQRSVSAAMQTSLLPPLPVVPGLELVARYQAAVRGLEVGGDWYDAFVLPDGAVALVIGDAAGHDTAAAARMAELRSGLRGLAVDRGEHPAAVLTRLDRVGAALRGDTCATCLYARLEQHAGGWLLRWSSAGHLPPVLLRRGRARLLETPADLLLGVDHASARHDHTEELLTGDVVLLCTDGLVETRTAALDERLGALLASLAGVTTEHPEALADRLLAELADAAEDDVAVLLVRVTA